MYGTLLFFRVTATKISLRSLIHEMDVVNTVIAILSCAIPCLMALIARKRKARKSTQKRVKRRKPSMRRSKGN